MIKQSITAVSLLLIACGILLTGCEKKATDVQVFDKATPEIKAVWDKALAADKANDYLVACTGYRTLLAQEDKLTADQAQVLKAASIAINQRLNAAVNSGDAAAKEVSQKLFHMQ